MASSVRIMTSKVPSDFWEKVFYPIRMRLRETDRLYRPADESQYLTFPFRVLRHEGHCDALSESWRPLFAGGVPCLSF